jgi:tetratricopeptide (TPR) repeat protein
MEQQNVQSSSSLPAQTGNVLVKKLGIVLSVFVFLLPIFFVPVGGVSLYVAKVTLLATGLVAIFAIFLSSVLSSGSIEIPKVRYLIPIGVFAVVAIISSSLSGAIGLSITGGVFDLGTSGFLIMLVFSLFMTLMAVKNLSTVGKVFSSFIYSSVALIVYTILGTFGSSIFPASLASKLPVFLSGGAIDTAIILGAATILSLCILNMTEVSKRMKVVVSILMAYAMIFIGAINFTPVIIILGLISLIFFVYILSWSVGSHNRGEAPTEGTSKEIENRKISLSSLVILIASIVLILGGTGIGSYLSKVIKVQATEVRPNFETTMNLAVTSWKSNFAFGVGPNRFTQFWAAHKPVDINQTQFWNADFYSGSGFVPTIAITTGLLGLLSLLSFIVLYVMSGVKAIFAQANSNRSRYLSTASFLVSLYFWIMLFLYTPSVATLALTFIFTGLFTATLVPQGIMGIWKINIFSNPKTNFLSVLSIVVLLVMSVAGGYIVWEKAVAAVVFESGVSEYQKTGNLQIAKEAVAKSINIAQSDIYWRGLTEISIADLGRVLSGITNQNQVTDAIRTEAQTLIATSVESAKKAVEFDDSNFSNWFILGRVYEILAQNGIEGSLESARNAYNEAAMRSPINPSVPLALARLEAMSGNIDATRQNINKALELKSNYTDAYYTLAQLEAAVNNIPAAIRSVEAATLVEPTNSGLYFQLGLLKYNQRDFTGAANALERAIALIPDYANAKYFLGISYYQLGKKEEAIGLFESLSVNNPDNGEVSQILSIMKSGKSLFSSTQSKTEPPIEEN